MALLCDRLKELRKNRSISQKEIAIELGISERNYRRYEMGEVDPPSSMALKLADYFNISVDYLLGRTDNPKRL